MKFSAGKVIKNNLSLSKKAKDLMAEIAANESLLKRPADPPEFTVHVDFFRLGSWLGISRESDRLSQVVQKLADKGFDLTKIVYGGSVYPLSSECPKLNKFFADKFHEDRIQNYEKNIAALKARLSSSSKNDEQLKLDWTKKSAVNLQNYFEQNKIPAEVGVVRAASQIKIIYDNRILPDAVIPLLIFEGIDYIDSNTGATLEF